MYLRLGEIQEVQIDHTGRCNLTCPQCARTKDNWYQEPENKGLDLTLDDYRIILEPFEEEKLKIFHCGNYGDALASPTFDETLLYTVSKKPRQISIATNGSLRSKSWWAELAGIYGQKIKVVFAIDGLEDTNAMYRVGSNFKKIMENASTFIDAGGLARWDFIEFKHNFHQIEEARKIAKDLGFQEFNAKYTSRFATSGKTYMQNMNVEDTEGNKNQKDFSQITKEFGTFDEYVMQTGISCKSKKNQSIFVDMYLRLWPCCWFGAPLYFKNTTEQKKSFIEIEKRYGKNFNSLRKHGWSLLDHEFFGSHLEKSWNEPGKKYDRIYTCGRTCGEKFEFSSGYGQNRNIQIIQEAGV